MTWPFENDTSAIVKKLAKRNVSSNRIFCFFNVLTIALAISLIVGISLFQQGSKISEQKILNQMQQATIGGLTAEQIEVLKKEPDLEDIVPYKHSDSFLMDGIKFEAVYMPTGFGIIKSYELVSGTCPEQYNEIVIDKNVQLELGNQLNIGDTITLPTAGSKTEDFIITGFTDNVETGTFYFYVSPAYAEQGVLLSDFPYSALIRVNGATEMGLIDFENTVYRLALSQDISRNQLYFNSKFCSSLISGSGMGGVLLATLFIAFSSGIVIYSVFYLSVSNQVSQIGQLKTIGMTEKQIKRMIRKEGYRFCLFGIPAGITVGIIFAYLLEPNGITIINAIATSIFAIILGIIIVQISVYKPAQIASNISPIEATKYVGNNPELKESRVRNRKNHIRLSPYSLAVLSEKQNRKKHNLTMAGCPMLKPVINELAVMPLPLPPSEADANRNTGESQEQSAQLRKPTQEERRYASELIVRLLDTGIMRKIGAAQRRMAQLPDGAEKIELLGQITKLETLRKDLQSRVFGNNVA